MASRRKLRWVARVPGTPEVPQPKATHIRELSMADLVTRWVYLESDGQSGWLTIRHSDDGQFAGDTWQPTLELAFAVTEDEFSLRDENWHPVPEEIDDPVSYGRAVLEQERDEADIAYCEQVESEPMIPLSVCLEHLGIETSSVTEKACSSPLPTSNSAMDKD